MPKRVIGSFFLLFLLGTVFSGCSIGTRTVQGDVVDYETEQPIFGAEVVLTSMGWGIRKGVLVWDKVTPFLGMTDKQGTFTITARRDATGVTVSKEGYETYYGWLDLDSSVHVQLKEQHPELIPLQSSILQIDTFSPKSHGWIFSAGTTTTDLTQADLSMRKSDSNSQHVILETFGQGGIAFTSAESLGTTSDFLTYADVAPESGYEKTVELSLEPGKEGPSGVYFVRTRDGKRYAKFTFGSGEFGLLGSDQDHRTGQWGLHLTYVYNSSGIKNLLFQN